ncbi:hypothetical protein N136_03407 [Leifsonia aquatica ATCC 14665]|uniref:Uncharacterized protein n=1 Tax=Leifsonia aquatica ATCC 14665 TaxID=1358026 RepID=U2R4R5_LEIAQ|nr:hypothetical protein N136_03407 [Leifsonia aquatica ATCC 14665]
MEVLSNERRFPLDPADPSAREEERVDYALMCAPRAARDPATAEESTGPS